jgi:hypothetical protein
MTRWLDDGCALYLYGSELYWGKDPIAYGVGTYDSLGQKLMGTLYRFCGILEPHRHHLFYRSLNTHAGSAHYWCLGWLPAEMRIDNGDIREIRNE